MTLFVAASFAAGYLLHKPAESAHSNNSPRKILYYHDPMHPAYQSDKPGIAPDCGMALEPVYSGDNAAGPPRHLPPGVVRIDSEKQDLLGLRTEKVERHTGERVLRAVGKIAADETRVDQITALADGVVRRVCAYAAGSIVRKDDLLATYFVATRDLFNAMQGFLLAAGKLDTNLTALRNNGVINTSQADARVEQELLQSYGITSKQIRDMIQTHEVTRDIEFRAPRSGIVLDRSISPGAVITKGTALFRIADLSRIWVLADVFENDADLYQPGTMARVTYEGRTYPATVTNARQFDATSRTLKVRLEMDNPGMTLRPEMFVNVELHTKQPEGLSVPADAVIDTGRTKVIYVSGGNAMYEPRTVVTGPEYDGRVQVLSGLQPGEAVVVSGLFLLDSESRLHAATPPPSHPIQLVAHRQPEKTTHGMLSDDPVCGMSLSSKTEHSSGFEGRTYYFCSPGCKSKFDQHPSAYAHSAEKTESGAPS